MERNNINDEYISLEEIYKKIKVNKVIMVKYMRKVRIDIITFENQRSEYITINDYNRVMESFEFNGENIIRDYNTKGYYDIYEVADRIFNTSIRTFVDNLYKSIQQLPYGFIRKIDLENVIIDSKKGKLIEEVYFISDFEEFLNKYHKLDYTDVLNNPDIMKWIKIRNMNVIRLGYLYDKYILKSDLEKLMTQNTDVSGQENNIKLDGYYNIQQITQIIFKRKRSDDRFIMNLKRSIEKLPKGMINKANSDDIHMKTHGRRLDKNVYNIEDFYEFLSSYVKLNEICNELDIDKCQLDKHIGCLNIGKIVLGNKEDQYISIKDKDCLIKYIKNLNDKKQEYNSNQYYDIYSIAEKYFDNNMDKRFIQSLKNSIENISKEIIGRVELEELILGENGEDIKYLYSSRDFQTFFKSYERVDKLYEEFKLGSNRIDKTIKLLKIDIVTLGNKNDEYILIRDRIKIVNYIFDNYKIIEEYANEGYYELSTIAEFIFDKKQANNSFVINLKKSIDQLPRGMINKTILDVPISDINDQNIVEELYLIDDFKGFLNSYIKLDEVHKEIEAHKVTISYYIKNLNVDIVVLGNRMDKYISNIDFERLKEEHKNSIEGKKSYFDYANEKGYYNFTEVKDILNVSEKTGTALIKKGTLNLIEVFNGAKFFEKEDIDNLKLIQAELLTEMKEKYYSKSEVRKIYGESAGQYISQYKDSRHGKLDKLKIDEVLRGYYEGSDRFLYSKDDVGKVLTSYYKYTMMRTMEVSNPIDDFIHKVENIVKVEFLQSQLNTKKLWYEYVKNKLIKSRIDDEKRIPNMVNQYVYNTEIIFKIFKNEIYTYTPADINTNYMNDKNGINFSYQRDFHGFLKNVIDSFIIERNIVIFNIKDINNPRDYERKKEVDNSTYTYDEYQNLYDYCNLVDQHKTKALNDAINYIYTNDEEEYGSYDSYWLYVMAHLTNNWRHGTFITQIPRISLSETSIESLEWLQENNITIEDANLIIYQISRNIIVVNKNSTNSKFGFNIGEPLKIAFATSIAICELRTRLYCDNYKVLFDFGSKSTFKASTSREFFSKFIDGFEFKNRKMNRTVSSLVNSITSYLGEDGSKAAQISRSHKTPKTTEKHYIKLTNQQIETLVLELFEGNKFGFVTKIMSDILFEGKYSKDVDTLHIKTINENFGDVHKIEVTSGLLNRLANDQEHARDYIMNLDYESLNKLHLKSMANLLPSRQIDYQCIYKECKFKDDLLDDKPKCSDCAGAIANVYILTNVMENYLYHIDYMANNFEKSSEGEKRRLANHFYLLHKTVNEARNKFGRKVVDNFIEGGTERIRETALSLNEKRIRQFKTSGLKV